MLNKNKKTNKQTYIQIPNLFIAHFSPIFENGLVTKFPLYLQPGGNNLRQKKNFFFFSINLL
jgi:hypothetical protein